MELIKLRKNKNMIITIHQPEYLPWIGFFDRINKSDIFVILDDVGYQKNGFINRNKIKTKDGWQWLTIPVKGRSFNKKINEVLIDNGKDWQKKHISLLKDNYSKASYFKEYYSFLEKTFSKNWENISDLDIYLIKNITDFLEIRTKIEKASILGVESEKTNRLVDICKKFKADTYLSGPGGKNYMDLNLFKKQGIKVVFQEFSHPEYSQQFIEKGFLHGMSVMDLLFNTGGKSLEIIKLGGKKNI